jgi:Ankyrin repeats (3 copies)
MVIPGDDPLFRDAIQGLRNGDFTRLDPLFEDGRIGEWFNAGLFDAAPDAAAEALSCACFNGRTAVAESLLERGVDPLAGNGTGMNAFHWAVNRGQLETVGMLIRRGVPLETRNSYGGTVLGAAVWAALNEPKPDHVAIIKALAQAGADLSESGYPTGNHPIDEVLRKHGAE